MHRLVAGADRGRVGSESANFWGGQQAFLLSARVL